MGLIYKVAGYLFKKLYPLKYTSEEMSIHWSYARRNIPIAILASIILSIITYFVLNDSISYSNGYSAKDLDEFEVRLKYVLLHLTPGITWIMACVGLVASKRALSPAIVPTTGYEEVTFSAQKILGNSVEQFLMSAFTQLTLIIHLDSNLVLNAIPTINLLFIIGRVLFWLGYPRYRPFGFILTITPTLIAMPYNLYKFFKLYI